MLIEYPSGDKTGATITLPNGNQSSNPRDQTISDPDDLNQMIQEAQESMQINIILLIFHIIMSSTSSKGDTQTRRGGSMRISYIGVNKLYYETRALFSSTSSRIYDKQKCEQVKVFLFYKSAMGLKTLLFKPTETKIGHIKFGQAQVAST